MKNDNSKTQKKNKNKKNKDTVTSMSQFAKVSSIIAVCTLGICPAFGIMAITVPLVFDIKKVPVKGKNLQKCKLAIILGIISLVLFVADVAIINHFFG